MQRSSFIGILAVVAATCGAATIAAQKPAPKAAASQPAHDPHAHHHPEAAKLKNPVPSSPESIAAGQKLYAKQCSSCHGDAGKGDGMQGEDMDPKPADLTDADWKHGDTDGEIFVVIRDGTKDGMKPFGRKLTAPQIWQLVNYVRTLRAKTPDRHHP